MDISPSLGYRIIREVRRDRQGGGRNSEEPHWVLVAHSDLLWAPGEEWTEGDTQGPMARCGPHCGIEVEPVLLWPVKGSSPVWPPQNLGSRSLRVYKQHREK